MSGLFISYRRSDSAPWAGRLKDHLDLRFGAGLVWRDFDSLNPGDDWLAEIRQSIAEADAVLVMIGPHWLAGAGGRRRLEEPGDVLAGEIAQALAGPAAVVPVLVGGAGMPGPQELPARLAELPGRQAALLRDQDWQQDVQILVEVLRGVVVTRRPTEPLNEVHRQLFRLQGGYFEQTDPKQALDLARQALRLLDSQLPHYPQDTQLALFRAYFLKNEAMALRDLGRYDEFDRSLAGAERAFRTFRQESEERTAGAYNGLGSVAFLRGDYAEALRWIDRALELVPGYPAARRDRENVLRQLEAGR